MRIKALAISAFILSSLVSYSFASNNCATIKDNEKRLACYDGDVNSNTTSHDSGKWAKSDRISPIDDSQTVVLSLESSDKVGSGFRSETPILIVRCQENKTNLYIDWNVFIQSGKTRIVTRLDKEKAITESWPVSSDNKATFSPTPIPFIKEMLGKDSLVVRVTPFNDNSYTVKFDIKGLDNAIAPVREACGW